MSLDHVHDDNIDREADGHAILPPQHAGYGRFIRTRVCVIPDVQTSASERRRCSRIRRWFAWLLEQHRHWYRGEEERQRREVEEDARRLGGRVTWDDVH